MKIHLVDKVKTLGCKINGSNQEIKPEATQELPPTQNGQDNEPAKPVDIRNQCIHPDDKIASDKVKAFPGFKKLMKYCSNLGLDQGIHMKNMTSFMRVTESQLPVVFQAVRRICEILRIDIPEIYLDFSTATPARIYGISRTTLVIGPPLLAFLEDACVLDAAIALECGHVFCRNCALRTLVEFEKDNLPKPIKVALNYWYAKSELSADRVASLVCGDAKTVIVAEMKLAGVGYGMPDCLADNMDLEAWAEQMDEIEAIGKDNKKDGIVQTILAATNFHAISALRVRELLKWVKSPEFAGIKEQIDTGNFE